jgi:hypothetical protein
MESKTIEQVRTTTAKQRAQTLFREASSENLFGIDRIKKIMPILRFILFGDWKLYPKEFSLDVQEKENYKTSNFLNHLLPERCSQTLEHLKKIGQDENLDRSLLSLGLVPEKIVLTVRKSYFEEAISLLETFKKGNFPSFGPKSLPFLCRGFISQIKGFCSRAGKQLSDIGTSEKELEDLCQAKKSPTSLPKVPQKKES